MKLPLSESKMNSFLLTALPEAVLRGDRRLLPWVYENFINIYSLPNGILMYTGLSLRSTLARGEAFLHYAIPQNTREATEFSVVNFCRKQIAEAGNYIYVFLDESKLSAMPSYGDKSYIHDSLLYGYDADRNGFLAIAQVDYHKKEVFYPADELEGAYRSAYSGSSEKAQLVAFRIPDKLCGTYPFSLERFLSRLADYVNSEQTIAEHYFAPENDMGITFGHAANRIFARKIPMDRSLSFIEFRTVNFMAEHRHGLLERLEYLTERYDFPKNWGAVVASYREIVTEYDRLRLLALKLHLSPHPNRTTNLHLQDGLFRLLDREELVLREVLSLAQHGETRDPRFSGQCPVSYSIATTAGTPEESYPGFSHAAVLQLTFSAEEWISGIRLSRRAVVALYDEEGLILWRFSPAESVGQSMTLTFPSRKVRQLEIRVWSDVEISEETMKIQPGKPDLAFGKKAMATSCWPDTDQMSFGPEQALSDDPKTFWNASRDWKPGEALTVDLGKEQPISQIRLTERPLRSRIRCYSLLVAGEDGNWMPIAEHRSGQWLGETQTLAAKYPAVRYVRLVVEETVADADGFDEPGIARLEVF